MSRSRPVHYYCRTTIRAKGDASGWEDGSDAALIHNRCRLERDRKEGKGRSTTAVTTTNDHSLSASSFESEEDKGMAGEAEEKASGKNAVSAAAAAAAAAATAVDVPHLTASPPVRRSASSPVVGSEHRMEDVGEEEGLKQESNRLLNLCASAAAVESALPKAAEIASAPLASTSNLMSGVTHTPTPILEQRASSRQRSATDTRVASERRSDRFENRKRADLPYLLWGNESKLVLYWRDLILISINLLISNTCLSMRLLAHLKRSPSTISISTPSAVEPLRLSSIYQPAAAQWVSTSV